MKKVGPDFIERKKVVPVLGRVWGSSLCVKKHSLSIVRWRRLAHKQTSAQPGWNTEKKNEMKAEMPQPIPFFARDQFSDEQALIHCSARECVCAVMAAGSTYDSASNFSHDVCCRCVCGFDCPARECVCQ